MRSYLGRAKESDLRPVRFKLWLVDGFYYGISDLETDLQKHDNQSLNSNKNSLINDTVAELQHWSTFEPEPEQRPEPKPRSQERFLHTGTLIRETPKTGRNDPCPCGSGKKFKKCCGR
ncbi:SEC-C metal-binding domain-containing protein [Endozoicomonas sp.]|uniref:YecA family protein n=1 Tax=Endozoicomonas sp. TaxID=1892382 RepID=UPI00288632FC|nr:SEC-C metal-binding domain-containing protein [Endozoicomonas sp.]